MCRDEDVYKMSSNCYKGREIFGCDLDLILSHHTLRRTRRHIRQPFDHPPNIHLKCFGLEQLSILDIS